MADLKVKQVRRYSRSTSEMARAKAVSVDEIESDDWKQKFLNLNQQTTLLENRSISASDSDVTQTQKNNFQRFFISAEQSQIPNFKDLESFGRENTKLNNDVSKENVKRNRLFAKSFPFLQKNCDLGSTFEREQIFNQNLKYKIDDSLEYSDESCRFKHKRKLSKHKFLSNLNLSTLRKNSDNLFTQNLFLSETGLKTEKSIFNKNCDKRKFNLLVKDVFDEIVAMPLENEELVGQSIENVDLQNSSETEPIHSELPNEVESNIISQSNPEATPSQQNSPLNSESNELNDANQSR